FSCAGDCILCSSVGATAFFSLGACASGAKADRSASSTSCAQWIFKGGNDPRGADKSSPLIVRASSTVLPEISSVATLATAIAVPQPNVWKVALSMTRFPSTSLNFTHMRNISPQSSLPTVPTASAPASSPKFFGCLIASSILLLKSSAGFIHLLQMVAGQLRINFYAPGIDAARHGPGIFKAVPAK